MRRNACLTIVSLAPLLLLAAFIPDTCAFPFRGQLVQGGRGDPYPGMKQPISIQVRMIPIDVIVTDKDNVPVLDLKKEDFTILENGIPQEIQNFSIQTLPATPGSGQSASVVYLLGYYPKEDVIAGQERQLSVRVSRPGLSLTFRDQSFVSDPTRSWGQQAQLAFERIIEAGRMSEEISDIPFEITLLEAITREGQPQVKIELKIDARQIKFTKENDLYSDRLRVAFLQANSEGSFQFDTWGTVTLNMLEPEYRRVSRSKITFTTQIPLFSPGRKLKIVVYDEGGEKLGSKVVSVQ